MQFHPSAFTAWLLALAVAGCMAPASSGGAGKPKPGSLLSGGSFIGPSGPKLSPEKGGGDWPWAQLVPAGGPKNDATVGQEGSLVGGGNSAAQAVGDFVQVGAPTVGQPSPPATPAAASSTAPAATPNPQASSSLLPTVAPSDAASTRPSAAPSQAPSPASSAGQPSAAPAVAVLSVEKTAGLTNKLELISRLGFQQGNAGMISNNGGSLLSNNGAGLLSNNGGGYRTFGLLGAGWRRLAQVPQPEVALDLLPRTGGPLPESLQVRRAWVAGGGKLRFRPPADATGDNFRDVDLHPNGNWAWREAEEAVLDRHSPSQAIRWLKVVKTTMGDDGRLRLHRNDQQEKLDGSLTAVRYKLSHPPFKVRVPESGVAQDIEEYELDVPTASGRFSYRFLNSNHTEVGTLRQVANGPGGTLAISAGDPLGVYAGTAEVRDAQGGLMYIKHRHLEGGRVFRKYDLGDGLILDLERGEGNLFSGPVLLNGEDVGDSTLGIYADGTHRFTLYLNGQSPKVVGYGYANPDLPAEPLPRAAWVTSTVAGGARGDVQGVGLGARFQDLRALVASPTVPKRWYLADKGANRILQVDLGSEFTVTSYAGTGQAGDANGAAAQASFRGPWGLAVGPDESLYVAEAEGHRVRRIRPNGGSPLVDTIAGDAAATGTANGPGASASFWQPTGLALIGQKLYVADTLNHRIRAIALDDAQFTVSTAAGSGVANVLDGPLNAASLYQPTCLVADGTNLVVSTLRTLRRIDFATQTISTVAGNIVLENPSQANFFDGPMGQAGLFPPSALWANPQGGWLTGSLDLRSIAADGSVRTLAGQSFFGAKDGEHDVASFNRIYGLAAVGEQGFLVAEARDPVQGTSLNASQLRYLQFRPAP